MDNIINISSERDNQGSPIINIIANKLQPMKDFSPVFIYTLNIVNKSLHISQKEINTFSIVININCSDVKNYKQIPFLPISLFKTTKVKSFKGKSEKKFFSSSTSNDIPSKHYVKSLDLYSKSFMRCFNKFYGKESNYVILALLPSYLERKNSSLIYMIN